MFSLLTRRIVSTLPVRCTNVATSSPLTLPAFVATRRTFYTTRHIQLPPAASTAKAKQTTGKKVTTKAKQKTKSKTKTKTGSKLKPKEKDQKPSLPKRVPKSEQPPPRPLNAYLLFFSRLLQNQKDDVKTLADTQAAAKLASATWKGFTIAEKQPFYDEVAVLRKQYDEKLHEYWKTSPPQVLKRINARRKAEGKKKIHRPHQEGDLTRPIGAFFRFSRNFRQSGDGRAIQEAGSTSTGKVAVNVAREAGKRWRAMSDIEKAPYVEAYQKEQADWAANHPNKGASASASS